MKKISFLLVSLTAIFLSGCTDEKVTNEWLVGNWECTTQNNDDPADKQALQLARLPNGNVKNYFSAVLTLTRRMSFKYQDGKYYYSRSENNLGEEFDVDKEYNVKNKIKPSGLFFINETNEIKRISSNKFEITFERTTRAKNSNHRFMNSDEKGKTICERLE